MSNKHEVFPGAKIGRWTVLDRCAGGRECRWLCRCDCGVERDILERSLRYGGSTSCGCLRKERAGDVNALELVGERFGKLTVLERAESGGYGGRRWKCRCDCGKEVVFPGTLLATGKRTSCGCDRMKHYVYSDISGQQFHRLTALYPVEGRTDKGGMIWRCRCECGNELDVSYNNLVYANMKSCGCKKREHDMMLQELQPHVDGTSICHLRSKKTPKNNTTGVKGVYLIKGKYAAKIVFQKKQYLLGTYDRLKDAAEARKKAEAVINEQATEFYERWKAKADVDHEWSENNPIRFSVVRRNGALEMEMLPRICD